MTPEKREQLEQVLLRGRKGIAVSQKDPPRVFEPRNTAQDIPFHFRDAADAKFLLLVCGAENALIVRTPDGKLEDEAVGLARRPNDGPFVFRHHIFYPFSFLLYSRSTSQNSIEHFRECVGASYLTAATGA